jgi:hypothetical protein
MLPDIVQQLSITFSFSDLNASQSQICSRNQILKKNLMLNWLRRSMKSFYHVNLMDLLSKSIGVSVRPKVGLGIGNRFQVHFRYRSRNFFIWNRNLLFFIFSKLYHVFLLLYGILISINLKLDKDLQKWTKIFNIWQQIWF